MMIHHVFVALYLVLLLINQSINQSAAQSLSSSSTGQSMYSPPIVTHITGCINQLNYTIDCARPARLTIHGSNFFNGLSSYAQPVGLLSIRINTGIVQLSASPRQENSSDTHLEFDLISRGYMALPQQQLFGVVVMNKLTKLSSPSFNGFSLISEPVPTITSVTGCRTSTADGKTAFDCDLVNDRVTLIGSGFMSIYNEYCTVRFGTQDRMFILTPRSPSSYNDFFVVFNDTQIVLSFVNTYLLLSAAAQKGVPQPLTFTQPTTWSTLPVWIQFTNLPQPVIHSIAFDPNSPGCIVDNSTGTPRFRDCMAGLSVVDVRGQYLFKGSKFFVGGIEALFPDFSGEGKGSLRMPVYQFTEGIFYDLTLVTSSGTKTWPPMFEFNTDPIITSVIPCVAPLRTATQTMSPDPRCMPGEKFQISVMNVRNPILPRVMFAHWSGLLECTDAVMVNSTSLFCTTPNEPSTLNSAGITVEWAGGEKTQNLWVGGIWDPVNSPRLTAVSGCYSNSGDLMYANQCVGSSVTGVVLTLSGTNLAALGVQMRLVTPNYQTVDSDLVIVDNQTVICTLPPFRDFSRVFDVMYPLMLSAEPATSNAVYITYVEREARDSGSSSNVVMVITVATIFSLLGAVLICVALAVVIRRSRKTRRQPAEFSSESSTGNHVELSEI